jgi:chloramphenicol 3-O-phosphotransferase
MENGKIVFLNGVSSAGKTNLAKTLQHKLAAPYYWLSEDIFRDMTPKKFDNEDSDENEQAWINAIFGMYHTAKTYSDLGLQRREKERGDRLTGLAEEQLSFLCPLDNTYDITVDTHNNTYEECADKIIKSLDCSGGVSAFKTLWARCAK